MSGLKIIFSNPWHLFMLIPVLALTLIPYFRLNKRYRRTRNRIVSMVLHLLVASLAVFVFAGMEFLYQVPNKENEIILLVDVSDTEEQASERRDDFVERVLREGSYDNFKVGVVTFGFDQQYAVPLTHDVGSVFSRYLDAQLPDVHATDVAAALTFTKDLFEYPQTAKIVLVTDGKETDENAAAVIRSVAAQGIRVDTAYVSSQFQRDIVQITGVGLPDYYVTAGDECTITLSLRSENALPVKITMTDNDEAVDSRDVDLLEGAQTISFKHTFKTTDLHKLGFEVTLSGDDWENNNQYCTYMYLEVFDRILIIERTSGESDVLVEKLNSQPDNREYNITVVAVGDTDKMPKTVDDLRKYDQVIMNNIAQEDIEGIEDELYSYVNDYGGGMLTVGGKDENGNAHAYDRQDMYGTVYQELLPVQAINYTPPVGVMVIIDTSGSMTSADPATGKAKLEWAKVGAESCLRSLTERDYIGIMTLGSRYTVELDMTRRTEESKIVNAIHGIEEANGSTAFSGAIDQAVVALRSVATIDRRHVIIVTDGEPNEMDGDDYKGSIERAYKDKSMPVTFSIVGIGMGGNSTPEQNMRDLATLGGGYFYGFTNAADITEAITKDLTMPEIKDVNMKPFYPVISDVTSPLLRGVERGGDGDDEGGRNQMTVALNGFFGVKVKDPSYLVLSGEYNVPVYAQWKFGKGMVGSFMCDLKGVNNESSWSYGFMNNQNGMRFIVNVVNNLFPTESLRINEIKAELKEENYISQLTVDANLKDGERLTGEILFDDGVTTVSLNALSTTADNEGCYVTTALSADNKYTKSTFVIKERGVYTIILRKVDANGNPIEGAECRLYKSFAYSKEYDPALHEDEEELRGALDQLATRGNGTLIADLEDTSDIFANFITALDRTFDPALTFLIIAIVLFLLDIAVRKFKFKWIHEIVKERKEKKNKN